jgi:hypothetical protein
MRLSTLIFVLLFSTISLANKMQVEAEFKKYLTKQINTENKANVKADDLDIDIISDRGRDENFYFMQFRAKGSKEHLHEWYIFKKNAKGEYEFSGMANREK